MPRACGRMGGGTTAKAAHARAPRGVPNDEASGVTVAAMARRTPFRRDARMRAGSAVVLHRRNTVRDGSSHVTSGSCECLTAHGNRRGTKRWRDSSERAAAQDRLPKCADLVPGRTNSSTTRGRPPGRRKSRRTPSGVCRRTGSLGSAREARGRYKCAHPHRDFPARARHGRGLASETRDAVNSQQQFSAAALRSAPAFKSAAHSEQLQSLRYAFW